MKSKQALQKTAREIASRFVNNEIGVMPDSEVKPGAHLICMRVKDRATPFADSKKRRCEDCGKKVWVDRMYLKMGLHYICAQCFAKVPMERVRMRTTTESIKKALKS